MGYLALAPETWAQVADRVERAHGPICWAWAAIREPDGSTKLASLRASAEPSPVEQTLDYGVLFLDRESLPPAEAARRLRRGIITRREGLAHLSYTPPSGHVPVHHRTTSIRGGYPSRSGWPEYVMSYDTANAVTGLQLRSIDQLIRGALPVYADGLAAVAEFVYDVPPSQPNIDTVGRIVVTLPDRRGRIAGLEMRGRNIVVELQGALKGCLLRAIWRLTPETTTWGRAQLGATAGLLRISTGRLPHDMWLYLCDERDAVIDSRGWAGEYGDRPSDAAFGKDHVRGLLREGEGVTLEFKEDLREEKTKRRFARTVAAFANGEGGVVLLGVTDDALPVGLGPKDYRDAIADVLRNRVRPTPTYRSKRVRYERRFLEAVIVDVGHDRPYRADGVVTVRFHATTRDAESAEIRALTAPSAQDYSRIGLPF